jgi:hypothetical protein
MGSGARLRHANITKTQLHPDIRMEGAEGSQALQHLAAYVCSHNAEINSGVTIALF